MRRDGVPPLALSIVYLFSLRVFSRFCMLGKPVIGLRNPFQYAFGLRVKHFFCNSARFRGAFSPVFGVLDGLGVHVGLLTTVSTGSVATPKPASVMYITFGPPTILA